MWIWIRSVITASIPVLFVRELGVSGWMYYVPGEIIWYVMLMNISPRWPLATPPNVHVTDRALDSSWRYIFCRYV